MKIIYGVVLLSVLSIGCASKAPSVYDSFSYRTNDFNETNIAVSEKGLSRDVISNILATKFPPENEVSIAVIFLYRYNSYTGTNNGLSYYIMNEGKNINNVEKFVPVPRIFIPQKLTFDIIQELGIRTLCEYTLLFYNNSNRTMTFSQFIHGEFKFESDIEFSLIDNQTTTHNVTKHENPAVLSFNIKNVFYFKNHLWRDEFTQSLASAKFLSPSCGYSPH